LQVLICDGVNITWGLAEDFSVYQTAVGDGFFFFLPLKSENHQNGLKIQFLNNSKHSTSPSCLH